MTPSSRSSEAIVSRLSAILTDLRPLLNLGTLTATSPRPLLLQYRTTLSDAGSKVSDINGLMENDSAKILIRSLAETIRGAVSRLEAWLFHPTGPAPPKRIRSSPLLSPLPPKPPPPQASPEYDAASVPAPAWQFVVPSGCGVDDVCGLDAEFRAVYQTLSLPLLHPETFLHPFRTPFHTILLFGPPGTGKTHLVRCAAASLGCKMLTISSADILSKWTGDSERSVATLFESAIAAAGVETESAASPANVRAARLPSPHRSVECVPADRCVQVGSTATPCASITSTEQCEAKMGVATRDYAGAVEEEGGVDGRGALMTCSPHGGRWSGVLLFLDELDALCSARSSGGSDGGSSRRVTTQLLVEMSKLNTLTEGWLRDYRERGVGSGGGFPCVFVVGATNTPWELDSAALRRFQQRVHVPLPTPPAIEALITKNLAVDAVRPGALLEAEEVVALAALLGGCSAADVESFCREVAMRPVHLLATSPAFYAVPLATETLWVPCRASRTGAIARDDLRVDSLLPHLVADFRLCRSVVRYFKPSVDAEEVAQHVAFCAKSGTVDVGVGGGECSESDGSEWVRSDVPGPGGRGCN